jgi:MFS family permease
MARNRTVAEAFYEWIANEEEGRICRGITPEACEVVPGNFFKLLLANSLSKLGDQLSNPKSTLPWLLQLMQAPVFLTALLTPIRESGSLLPQVWIGGVVRQISVRKWVWIGGNIAQCAAIAGMGLTAITLRGPIGGWTIITLLMTFSLARGFCSIASKDVFGKTIPKTRRGLLNGLMGSFAGAIAAATGLLFVFNPAWESNAILAILLAAAASLWLLSALMVLVVKEYPGATDGGENGWAGSWERFGLLGNDRDFRQFVVSRSLALGSSLAAPFYVALAQTELGSSFRYLGYFIIAEGMAGLISGTYWGKLADRSSRMVMASASTLAAVVTLLVVIYSSSSPISELVSGAVFYPLAFFLLGVAHAGVRTGRKTQLIDMASGNKRTDYVSVSNTCLGIVLLIVGIIGAAIASISIQAVLLFMAALSLGGAITSFRLKQVQ